MRILSDDVDAMASLSSTLEDVELKDPKDQATVTRDLLERDNILDILNRTQHYQQLLFDHHQTMLRRIIR